MAPIPSATNQTLPASQNASTNNTAAPRRPVRIAGASGGFSDRIHAISRIAHNEDVDVIVGDWMSELTMSAQGVQKVQTQQSNFSAGKLAKDFSFDEQVAQAAYAESFLWCFEPAIHDLANKGIKLAVNAGASDTELLAKVVHKMIKEKGYARKLKVAWIEGDDATGAVKHLLEQGERFDSLMHGRSVKEWGIDPVVAQCYLGGMGICRALQEGADVVICGRVSDASPIIGAAAWWHGWNASQLDELAGSLVMGHLLECASYVCGGYCSDFVRMLKEGKHLNVGFPLAEIDEKGEGVMYKEKNTGGQMTVSSVTSQLLYEIQGPWYYNCDVTASLEGIRIEQVGEDRVKVSGVKGLPPPPTTKVGITGLAGWQAEYHVYLVGLNIAEKCRWTEDQIRYELGEETLSKFTTLKFMQNGTSPLDAHNQDVATVDFRIFAQSRDRELLSMRNPNGFFRKSMVTFLMSCPGASLGNDMRLAEGKPYFEYHPALLPQSSIPQKVHVLDNEDMEKSSTIDIPLAPKFRTYPKQQPSYETTDSVHLDSWGETVRMPLGLIALGRSGDKCSDCNVGLFVRHDDEWDWLRSLLTVPKIRELLGPDEDKGKPIDRFEMPKIKAVHFLLHDHLDRGFDACSTYDTLGKNCCEYLRAKVVDVPKRFIERGTVF